MSQNEDTRELIVHLATNTVVTVPGPIYDRGMNVFDIFPFLCDGHEHEVKTYTHIYTPFHKRTYVICYASIWMY